MFSTALLLATTIVVGQSEGRSVGNELLKAYADAVVGEWTGESTLSYDIPGVGKKGETVTGTATTKWILEGTAVQCDWQFGGAVGKWIAIWDAEKIVIRSHHFNSAGNFAVGTISKQGNKWVHKTKGVSGEGEHFTRATVMTSTDNGNIVLDEYLDFSRQEEAIQTDALIKLLEEEQQRRKTEVDTLRERVRALNKEAIEKRPSPFQPMTSPDGDAISQLLSLLANESIDKKIVEWMLAALKRSIAEGQIHVSEADIRRAVEEHPETQKITASIREVLSALSQYDSASVVGKSHPRYVDLEEKLRKERESLEQTKKRLFLELSAQLRTYSLEQQRNKIAEFEQRVKKLEILENVLQKHIKKEAVERAGMTGKTMQLEFARLDLHRAEQVYQQITDRILALRIEILALKTKKRAVVSEDTTQVPGGEKQPGFRHTWKRISE